MQKKNHPSFSGGTNGDIELLRSALDSSVTGIIITDNLLDDNPIIYCNAAFEQISGYSREEIIGRNCRFLQGTDRSQAARQELKNAVVNGQPLTIELRNYRKDGVLFWNELHMSPIIDKSGKVTNFIGVQNDVTRRKEAEENLKYEKEQTEEKIRKRTAELQASEEYLNSIVQTVREGLIVLDTDYNVITANDFFLKTFKVERRDTEGKSLYDLGNGQWNIEALKILLEKILPTNNPVLDFEVSHDFPHIGKKLMLLNAHRIELEGHYKDRILLAIEDITDLRMIEQRKDDFLSVASHELKTPLTTIKGYTQTLSRLLATDNNPKIKQILERNNIQIERLNRIINDLLDMSRIQTGKLQLQQDRFDFTKMVKEAIEQQQALINSHEIIFNEHAVHMVKGDESQLSQVVSNLLTNAIKYSPEAIKINVNISRVSDYLKFSVMDYGFGIDVEDQKHIFDRFYRVGNVQKHYPGMGIGLYICEQIVSIHGGKLWVDSEPLKGSTFSFTLPVKGADQDE